MAYVVEIDQSGRKIEKTDKETIVAFADGKDRAIRIPTHVKREAIRELRRRGKSDSLNYLLFATALHLLLKDDIEDIDRATIDIEYRGYEAQIKEHLVNLLRRAGKKVQPYQIHFDRITKQSPAHKVAIQTFRGQRRADHTVTHEEFMREL